MKQEAKARMQKERERAFCSYEMKETMAEEAKESPKKQKKEDALMKKGKEMRKKGEM